MASDSYPVFPFYLVIDCSLSMADALPAINDELPALKREVELDPIVGDIARFGVITFSSKPQMLLPLSDLMNVTEMPVLRAQHSTCYSTVFDLLGGAIRHDIEWFKNNGSKIYRPAVFFISDGRPNLADDWKPMHDALIDPSFDYRPNIVSFGFGEADEETIATVATFKAFAADNGESPAQSLRTIGKELTRSIMASSQAASQGQSVLTLPNNIPGMHEIPLDLL